MEKWTSAKIKKSISKFPCSFCNKEIIPGEEYAEDAFSKGTIRSYHFINSDNNCYKQKTAEELAELYHLTNVYPESKIINGELNFIGEQGSEFSLSFSNGCRITINEPRLKGRKNGKQTKEGSEK